MFYIFFVKNFLIEGKSLEGALRMSPDYDLPCLMPPMAQYYLPLYYEFKSSDMGIQYRIISSKMAVKNY
jgi:hypothetical protein